MNLDDWGYFDGDVFVFHKPFPYINSEGVYLIERLDCSAWIKLGADVEVAVSGILEQQRGVPDPLSERHPHQEAPKKDPGE